MRWLLVLAAGFAALTLSGCSATELENRCFPMLAVVDYDGKQVKFAYGFPQLSQKENTDVEESKVDAPMTEGASFREAYENYSGELDKKADCNHLKALVFSEAFLQQTDMRDQMIDYLQESELFPRNVYVCVADDPKALMEAEKSLPTDVGSYLETYLQNQEPQKDAKLVNLGTVLDESENHQKAVQLPYLTTEDDAVLWDGYYVLGPGFGT